MIHSNKMTPVLCSSSKKFPQAVDGNKYRHAYLDNGQRVRCVEFLSTKCDVLINPFPQALEIPVDSEVENVSQIDYMEDSKGTRLSKHSRVNEHMNSLSRMVKKHRACMGLGQRGFHCSEWKLLQVSIPNLDAI